MKTLSLLVMLIGLAGTVIADRYVRIDGPGIAPYDTWARAASVIQVAVDAAGSNETVWVSNGVYRTGGDYKTDITYSNRVIAVKPIIIRSVNGPAVTIIEGQPAPNGNCGTGAVRCVYISDGAQLIGFTLSNGYTNIRGDYQGSWGGGVVSFSGSRISSCVITRCTAESYGGGASLFYSTMENTEIRETMVNIHSGVGVIANYSLVSNCTVRSMLNPESSALFLNQNSTGMFCVVEGNGRGVALFGSSVLMDSRVANNTDQGVYMMDGSRLTRSVIYGNHSPRKGAGVFSRASVIDNCVIAGNVSTNDGGGVYLEAFGNLMANCTVVGNISSNQGGGLFCYNNTTNANNIILYNTAGIAATSNYYTKYNSYAFYNCCTAPIPSGGLTCSGNFSADPRFADTAGNDYHLTSGSGCYNAGLNAFKTSDEDCAGVQRVIVGFVDVGAHEYVPRLAVPSALHYADPAGGNIWPYTNAATAALTLQAALDTADNGDRVLVAPAVYSRNYASYRGLKSRAVAKRAISIEATSSNTPGATVLLGESDIGGGLGSQGFAMRCLTITSGVSVCGFTLSNGFTRDSGTPINYLRSGGGVLCDRGGMLSRCVVSDSHAASSGGGVMCNNGGAILSSVLQGNTSREGGAAFFYNKGLARNCLVARNAAVVSGGGLYCDTGGDFQSCTIVDNTAGTAGGGVYLFLDGASNLNNIIYHNVASASSNLFLLLGTVGYSCTVPLPQSTINIGGNITAAPWFVNRAAGDYQLLDGSPCINDGTNLPWMAGANDLEGNPRVYDSQVDIGCYEYIPEPASIIMLLVLLAGCHTRRIGDN